MIPCRACGGSPGAPRVGWRYDEECRACGAYGIDPGGPVADAPANVARRPVAGWAEVYPGLWVLGDESALVRASIRAARALGDFWWGIDTPGVIGQRGGRAPTLEAAQLAAEDALRAVLVDAAAALWLRVVPS